MNIVTMNTLSERYFGGKPKSPKPPPPPDPTPTPTEVDADVKQKERDRRRQKISQAGRGGTILTSGIPLTGNANATLLGRSTA